MSPIEPTGLEPGSELPQGVETPVTAPAPAKEDLILSALGALLAKLDTPATPAPATPAPATPAPASAPVVAGTETAYVAQSLSAGQLVTHTYEGPHGTVKQVGVVIDVLEADRVTVAWYSGLSGPLLTTALVAV